MNELIKMKIDMQCEFVKRGKPCACESIQDRYFIEASIIIIEEYKLKTYSVCLADGWKTIWIYKDNFMLEIIESLPDKPITNYDHWILGKAFGYSDGAIKEFIESKGGNNIEEINYEIS